MQTVACLPALLVLTGSLPALSAQSAAPRAADPNPPAVVELSPFRVDATQDRGYSVTRDVSGSRLNADLKDVAAPLTVFTQEMLQDLNAINVLGALDFAANTLRDEQGLSNVDFNNVPIRVRGIRGGSADSSSATQDFFPVYDDLDAYKIDRMGFGRGPNSILFGVGLPAGVITASTKQALFQDAYELQARFDTWGSARGVADANKVIVPGRLALRTVYLQQYQTGAIQPQYKRDTRLYLASTLKIVDRPGLRTTLRANFERIDGDDVVPNGGLPRDSLTLWLEQGSPTSPLVGAGAAAATRLPGTSNQSTANQLVFVNDPIGGNTLLNWRNMLQADGRSPAPILDERIAPYDVNVKGNNGNVPRHNRHMSVFVDQQLGQDLFLELAAFRGEEYREWGIKIGGIGIGGDPNRLLPDGRPNPNAGKPYV
jgi:outer membrane receptor protein involved in Fe transport